MQINEVYMFLYAIAKKEPKPVFQRHGGVTVSMARGKLQYIM